VHKLWFVQASKGVYGFGLDDERAIAAQALDTEWGQHVIGKIDEQAVWRRAQIFFDEGPLLVAGEA